MNVPPKDELPYVEWIDDAGEAGRIYADVPESEDTESPAVVTQNPVEKGARITDHYRPENDQIQLELFFSDSPIRYDLTDVPSRDEIVTLDIPQPPGPPLLSTAALVGAIGSLLGASGPPPIKQPVRKFARPLNRVSQAFEQFRKIRDKGWLVNVRTTTELYEGCAITNIKKTRNAQTGNGGKISLSIQQIRFVQSDVTIAVPLPSVPRAQKKKPPKDEGAKEITGERKKSMAAAALDSLTGGAGL
jgi:hypothetical protein